MSSVWICISRLPRHISHPYMPTPQDTFIITNGYQGITLVDCAFFNVEIQVSISITCGFYFIYCHHCSFIEIIYILPLYFRSNGWARQCRYFYCSISDSIAITIAEILFRIRNSSVCSISVRICRSILYGIAIDKRQLEIAPTIDNITIRSPSSIRVIVIRQVMIIFRCSNLHRL